MSSSQSFCGICDIRHISKPSDVWCPDCDEGLCTACLDNHSLAKPCRNHTTIPIAEYRKLPSYVLEITEHCCEHNGKFQLYCKEHGSPCCGICIMETHRDCMDVAILENMAKDVKTSDIFNEIDELITEMTETIAKIRLNRETNSSALREKKIIVENEIRELRTKINIHLDKLQEDLMKEFTEAEITITEKTRELLVSLHEKQKELTEHKKNIVIIKTHASDLQTLLAIKHIQNDLETHDTSLQALVNSDNLNQTKLSYKIDTGLKTITTNIQKLGEIVVESKPCVTTFIRKKDKQAQMMVADLSPPISVENIHLKLKQMINIKGSRIRGCSLLPEDRMVFSCYDADIVRCVNKDGVELSQIGRYVIGSYAYDTVYIKDNNSVSVSSGAGRNGCITMVDIVSQEVITTISLDANSYGMAVAGRTIYYCALDKGLKILNLSDNSVSDIINSDMSGVYHVATSGDKLYYTNYNTHTVTCCDLHGTTQWEFNDERILQRPFGISVDNDGNVYVVCCRSNNDVVISPDGKRQRQILSFQDGLVNPHVLDYDRSTNRLLVVNESTTAFLFDVTRGE